MSGLPVAIALAELKAAPVERALAIDAADLRGVADRLDLPDLSSLTGNVKVRLTSPTNIEVSGNLHARLTQICSVTLEPFETTVEEPFVQVFTTDPAVAAADVEDPLDDASWPELLDEDSLDLTEFLIQQLALSLDPHPRAPGVALEAAEEPAEDASVRRPFEGLGELLKRDK